MHANKKRDALCCDKLVAGGLISVFILFLVVIAVRVAVPAEGVEPQPTQEELSLLTETPEEGMQLAIRLARLGVTETQPDRAVLHELRPEYASDPDALIAASHVIAVHFQTVAAANDYWR